MTVIALHLTIANDDDDTPENDEKLADLVAGVLRQYAIGRFALLNSALVEVPVCPCGCGSANVLTR